MPAVPPSDPYVENPDYVPSPYHQIVTQDTTGTDRYDYRRGDKTRRPTVAEALELVGIEPETEPEPEQVITIGGGSLSIPVSAISQTATSSSEFLTVTWNFPKDGGAEPTSNLEEGSDPPDPPAPPGPKAAPKRARAPRKDKGVARGPRKKASDDA